MGLVTMTWYEKLEELYGGPQEVGDMWLYEDAQRCLNLVREMEALKIRECLVDVVKMLRSDFYLHKTSPALAVKIMGWEEGSEARLLWSNLVGEAIRCHITVASAVLEAEVSPQN